MSRSTIVHAFALGTACVLLLVATAAATDTLPPPSGTSARTETAASTATRAGPRANLPTDFVENRGQWPSRVRFVARTGSVAAAFAEDGLTLRYGSHEPVSLLFDGASGPAELVGEGQRPGHYNYIVGNEPKAWRLGVPRYESVLYRSLYDGVDVRVREEAGRLEYDLLLAPHADLAPVAIRATEAEGLEIASDGALLLRTAAGTLRQTPPRTWEMLPGGERRSLSAHFRIIDAQRYGFVVPQRDPALALVIDPGLDWSTFVGGGLEDYVNGVDVARDGSGDLFLTGVTSSTDFPGGTLGAGGQKVYVARLSANGSELRYVTLLGGSAATGTYVGRVVSDSTGSVAVIGSTSDATFPVTASAYQTALNGVSDAFVVRLNGAGALTAATFLGGMDDESGAFTSRGVAFDPSGAVIVAGVTLSPDFPTTTGAFDRTFNPPDEFTTDTFIARLSPALNQLTYSTFLGPQVWVKDLVVDPQGFVTISGETGPGLPTTAGALDRVFNNGVQGVGGEDGFVARLKLDGAGAADLKYSTYLGGHNRDEAWGLAFDPNNPELVTVVGWTWQDFFARDFPTTAGSLRPNPLPLTSTTPADPYVQEGFVTRFRFPATGGGSLVWSTFIGGSLWDHATDVAIDSTGAAVVLGGTRAYDFPTTRGAFDRTLGGIAGFPYDCFVSRISADGSQLLYSTFLGGNGAEQMAGSLGTECDQPALNDEAHIVYVGGNSVVVAGETKSPDFPTSPGAFDTSYAPGPAGFMPTRDAFVTRLTVTPDASGDLTVGTPNLVFPANGATFPTSGPLELEWDPVADPSGIEAYNYQVSSRSDFPANFIQYRGSVSAPRLLLQSPGLITYFWRVQAADRAGNLGEWSAPSSFTMGVANAAPVLSFIRLDPNRVTGGGTSSATAFLNFGAVAPPGGAVVALRSSNPAVASVPASVTIPAGANSAVFSITSSQVTATTQVSITGELGLTQTQTLTVEPPTIVLLTSVTLNPSSVTGGSASTGTVTLSGAAPAGGANVLLTSNNTTVATVPGSVTVPAGATSATFAVTTVSVAATTSVNISVHYGASLFATLTVTAAGGTGPTLSSVSLNPNSVVGGSTSVGTVTLSGAAPSGGRVVSLSDNSSSVGVPASVTVPAGSTSGTFTATTTAVTTVTSATITATLAGTTRTATLTVNPTSGGAPSAPTLQGPSNGATPTQPVAFNWTNVTNAVSYEIQIDNSSTISAPFVASQTTTVSQASIGGLPAQRLWWRVRAQNAAGVFGAFSSTRSFTPQAEGGSAASLSALSVNPTSVTGGNSATGTVTLTAAAPTGGASVGLSDNSAAATVPASVTVPAGSTSATFTITTTTVTTATPVTITGSFGGATRTATLTVNPTAAAPSLSVLSVNPTSVTGGNSSTGTVTLTSAAPTGGAAVSLSDNSAAATVPASVTVPAGATSATFTVTTTTVTTATPVTITGAFGGATRTATLAVNPAGGTAVTLTVTATGRSGERITSAPAGINVAVGSTGSASFNSGTAITLSVTNGRDAIWSGACSSGGDKTRTCTFTLTGNASVTGNVQ